MVMAGMVGTGRFFLGRWMRAVQLACQQSRAARLTDLWRAQVDQRSFLLSRQVLELCHHRLRRLLPRQLRRRRRRHRRRRRLLHHPTPLQQVVELSPVLYL